MQVRRICVALILGVILATPLLWAERVNTVSGAVDTVAGIDNNPSVSGLQLNRVSDNYYWTWGLYPSLRWDSQGEHSLFSLNYAFGLNRVEKTRVNGTDINLNSESHSAGAGWTLDTERVSVRFSEQFRRSPDFGTFNLFQGIVFTPEGMFFDYETVALRRNSYENTASLNLDYRFGARSTFTFGAGHSLRDYESNELFRRRLPNQQRLSANAGYRRDLTGRTSFETRYQADYLQFQSGVYSDVLNHDLSMGFRHQFSPTVQMTLMVGPSYARQTGTGLDYWGHNASVNISKEFEREMISAYYRHSNGTSTGVGSISIVDRLGFGFTHIFGRRVSADFGLSAYKTRRSLDNPIDLKGVSSSLVLGLLFGRNMSVNAGASYNDQRENTDLVDMSPAGFYTLNRTRIFISLRFDLPEFWRF